MRINGQSYHSSEQYIQHQKCLVFGDHETADSILKVETAIDYKSIGRDVKNFEPERWKQNAKARCTPDILAKFKQNPLLSEFLKSTGTKTIVESCRDREWGTGVPLYDPNSLDSDTWNSQGLLGEILEAVCTTLVASGTSLMETSSLQNIRS